MFFENSMRMAVKEVVKSVLQNKYESGVEGCSVDCPLVMPIRNNIARSLANRPVRMELVGPNNPLTFAELMNAAEKKGVHPDRVVGTLGGFGGLKDGDLMKMAAVALAYDSQFIGTPISPLMNVEGVKEGWQPCEGAFFGLHLRDEETIEEYLFQLIRGAENGLRRFLAWDRVVLPCVHLLQHRGILPTTIFFKASIFGGCSHAYDVQRWWRWATVESVNPVPLKVGGFGRLRQACPETPFDIHFTALDSMGGLNRMKEAHEIISAAAPVNVKIERGKDVPAMADQATLLKKVLPKVLDSTKEFLDAMKSHPDIALKMARI